jgi:RNA polymerase sigma-70 factor (ECF subfamily)
VPARRPTPALHDDLAVAARGDLDAFARVYDRLAVRVYGLAAQLCGGDGPRAERAAESALVAVWRQAPCYLPGQVSPTAWALGVAHRHLVSLIPDRSAPSGAAAPTAGVVLSGLSADQAAVVTGAFFEGRTASALGRRLGLPEPRVRRVMRASLRRLERGRVMIRPTGA